MSAKPSSQPAARNRMEQARSGPRLPLVAVAALALAAVVVIAAVIIVVVGGDDDDVSTGGPAGDDAAFVSPAAGTQPFGPVTVEGEALATLDRGGEIDPAVGQPAPTLTGETPGGEAITVDPADGPMVLVFVAHWCPHCGAEVPRIVELAGQVAEIDGVPFVAVATGTNPQAPNFPPGSWLAGEDWPGSALLDDERGSAAVAYGLSSYPFLVAVGGDGTVVARSAGELGEDGLKDFFAAAGG